MIRGLGLMRRQSSRGLAELVPPVVRGVMNGWEGHHTDSGRSMDGSSGDLGSDRNV